MLKTRDTNHAGSNELALHTILNDGIPVCIRRVTPDDEQRLKHGLAKLSDRSRYLRFFSGMKKPPQHVIDNLLDIDGYEHIAWGAVRTDDPQQPALGIVHAFRDSDDDESAQYAVAVIDEYHGLGLARLLTAVLLLDCQEKGIRELTVDVLSENKNALALTRLLGGVSQAYEAGVREFDIEIEKALKILEAQKDLLGIADILKNWDDQVLDSRGILPGN